MKKLKRSMALFIAILMIFGSSFSSFAGASQTESKPEEEVNQEESADTLEAPADNLTEPLALLSMEDPAEDPAEDSEEKPSEETAAKPARVPVAKPAEDPSEDPAEDPAEGPAEGPAEDPEENPAEDPAEDTAEDSAEDPAAKPAEDPAVKPARKPLAKPAAVSAAKPAAVSAAKPAAVPLAKPAEDPEEKPIAKPGVITTQGIYTLDDDSIVVPIQLKESSISHTMPLLVWTKDGTLYTAVKSIYDLEQMKVNGLTSTVFDEYAALVKIKVEGTEYAPEDGLKGNTQDSHWTVFRFKLSELTAPKDETIEISIKSTQDPSYGLAGTLSTKIPKINILSEIKWLDGENPQAVELQLKRHLVVTMDSSALVVKTQILDGSEIPAWTYSWKDMPEYNSYGQKYVYFVEEELVDEEELDLEEPFINELVENYPDMLGEPSLIFPNINFRTMRTRYGLSDTIEVDKTAVRSPGCRTFEVTLDITGTPQKAPVDVVLVIDRSGSMEDGNVIEYVAIESAPSTNKSYYVKINGSYQSVSYNSWYSDWVYGSIVNRRHVKWDANGDDVNPGSDSSNNPLGKPFYESYGRSRMYMAKQAAVNFAAKVLGPGGVAGSRVSIVSYAGPTSSSGSGSYGIQGHAKTDQDLTNDIGLVNSAIAGLEANGGTNTQAGFIQAKSVIQGSISNENPNSSKVVIMFTDGMPTSSNGNAYGPNDPTDHNNHTIAAYTAGQDIYTNGIADVFTVGLFEGMTGGVYSLAVDTLTRAQNKGFYDAPTAGALDGIFDTISTQLGYAATQAVVVDKIGDNFELVPGTLTGGTYSENTREITWNPGTIYSSAQLKYIVQAKPEFAGGKADTNKFATLTYTDIFGTAGKTKTFPIPEVDVPTPIEISLTDATVILGGSISLGEGTDPSGENYMSPVTGGDGNGTYTYEWRVVGDDTVLSTVKNPSVSPAVTTGYEVTVKDSNGCTAKASMTVRLTKTITANKVWVNGPAARPTVWFKLYRNIPGGDLEEVPGSVLQKLESSDTTANWSGLDITDDNGNPYTFSVKEGQVVGTAFTEGPPPNYEVSYSSDTMTVTNTYQIPMTGEVEANKVWVNGPAEHPTVWFKLYRNIPGGDLEEVPGSALQNLESGDTTASWTGLATTDVNGNPYTFSVKEGQLEGTTFTEGAPCYYKETYSEDKLTVTNTYTLTTVNVSKVVKGNMGDRNKDFLFIATLSDGVQFPDFSGNYTIDSSNLSEATFTLQHGESVSLIIPIGASLSIEESGNEGYDVSVEQDGNSVIYPNLTVTVPNEETTIKFINKKNITIDSGVLLNSLPYIIILLIVVIGGLGWFIRKRRHIDFE